MQNNGVPDGNENQIESNEMCILDRVQELKQVPKGPMSMKMSTRARLSRP